MRDSSEVILFCKGSQMTSGKGLEFDIVLATRNRPEVLQISIPLMLSQSRLPRRFIVVDSSSDHAHVRRVVEGLFAKATAALELLIFESATAGSSYQRNIGLKFVESPVVIFPDDDSLWYPGVADGVMRIYERDTNWEVGSVAMTVAATYPEGVFGSSEALYQLETRDRLAKAIRKFTSPIEEKLLPDPINPGKAWMTVWGVRESLSWLREEDAELCGPVFGYRMSFRTEVIRGLGGFDERLGRYSMFEDSDASIGSLQKHLNVCAGRARVFHYRVPGKRVNGTEFGIMAILNRTYVACKHAPPRSKARRQLGRYLYYKLARYLFQSFTAYGRRRFWGALRTLPEARRLMEVGIAELPIQYVKARTDCVKRFEGAELQRGR
jgi:glycosyltransferase involved in cell wall biosynthesis